MDSLELSCSQRIMHNILSCMADFTLNLNVNENYRFGFSEEQCVKALKELHTLIKNIYDKAFTNPELFDLPVIYGVVGASGTDYMKSYHSVYRIMNLLYALGEAGNIDVRQDEIVLLIDGKLLYQLCEKMKPKTPERLLMGLGNVGLICEDIICDSKLLKLKDLKSFVLRCQQKSTSLIGLKVFSAVAKKFDFTYFVRADMSIVSYCNPKDVKLQINHIISAVPQKNQKSFITGIHNVLTNVGCKENIDVWLDRANWKAQYYHPKMGKKIIATLFVEPDNIILKLNLRNLGKYDTYLETCPIYIQQHVINSFECSGCNGKACIGGIKFKYNNKHFNKCYNESFRFNINQEDYTDDFKKLIELEVENI